MYPALSPGGGAGGSGGGGGGGSWVALPSSWALAGSSDTDPEPDEPPQATSSAENRHTQMAARAVDADCVRRETEEPDRWLESDERVFILGYSVSFAKQITFSPASAIPAGSGGAVILAFQLRYGY